MADFACRLLDGVRKASRIALAAFFLWAGVQVVNPRIASAATCFLATSASSHALCWLDLTSYSPVSGHGTSATAGVATPLTFTLPDGSTLALTMTTTVTSPSASFTTAKVAIPTWGSAALGAVAYMGVSGKPAIYTYDGDPISTQISSMTLKDPSGAALSTIAIAGADAESTNYGNPDHNNESISWGTSGPALSQLQLIPNTSGSSTTICTLSFTSASSATCGHPGFVGAVGAYILAAAVSSSDTFSISSYGLGSNQGYAFAIDIAQVTAAATISSRSNSTDEFTVKTVRSGTTLTSASTSGAGTNVSAGLGVFPTDTYTLSETAASGSMSTYVTTYACTNAVSSSTTLPSGTGTSVSITPVVDDQITCAFTSNGLSMTAVAPSAQNLAAPATVTDTFTLTNTSAIAATFAIGTVAVNGSSSGSITPSGYVVGGMTYSTLGAAQSAIASTAANGSITFGVQYSAPATPQTITTSLAATTTSGSSASPSSTASVTDSLGTGLALSKTGTTATSPGGIIAWTILATNNGPSANNGAVFSDPVPAGLTIAGTPTCGSAAGGAACGAISITGNTVTSTITTFPAFSSVTFTIHAVAGNATSYTNTAALTPVSGSAVSASLTTSVAQPNGLNETVRNITTGSASGQTLATASPGDTIEFDLSFTNVSTVVLQNFTFADTLPANVTFVSATCGSLPAGITACAPTTPAVGGSGTVTFSFAGALASGSTLTAAIRVKIS